MQVFERFEGEDLPNLTVLELEALSKHMKSTEIEDFGERSDITRGVRERIDHARQVASEYKPGKKDAIAGVAALAVTFALGSYIRSKNRN